MDRRLRQGLFVCAAAALASACSPPRATWVKPDAGASRRTVATRERKPPVDVGGAGGHDQGSELVHVVAKGENLFRIGLKYGVDPEELADRNEIVDPTELAVGRELVIPGRRRVADAKATGATGPARTRAAAQARVAPERRDARAGGGGGRKAFLRWPLEGVLYSRFGPRGAARHDGIDISAPEGTKIGAAAPGTVLYSGTQRGYGNIVILRHDGDLVTLYAHNRRNLVKEGQQVEAGHPIAEVGRTGRATGPHCHFEVRRGTEPHDPLDFLPR